MPNSDVDLAGLHVTGDLALTGGRLADVAPPTGAVVTAVVHGGEVVVPHATIEARVGDLRLITTPRGGVSVESLTARARGER
jgi:Trk K+ transport system NAD-binding subunit